MSKQDAALYREALPDGSRIERNSRVEADGSRVGIGNWLWVIYDPDRRPSRKKVNLRTKDKGAAMRLATDHARRRALGAYDPWREANPEHGVTVGEAAARYLVAKQRTASPATVEGDRGHLARFERVLPAGTLLRHVERAHVVAFVNAPKPKTADGLRGGGEARPETKRRRLASIQHFLSWAVASGLRADNPAAGTPLPKAPVSRREHVTPAETAAMLRAIAAAEVESGEPREWLKDWLIFAAATGLRPGEQRQLQWSAVRLAEQSVEVGRGHRVKTRGSARTVPVRGEALAILQRRHEARTTEADGPVFTGAGGGAVNERYLSKCLQRFATDASVRKNVTSYCLRHAYGTEMAARGVPLFVLAKLMGTSVRMIEAHYGHHDPERAAAHVERVFGFTTPQESLSPLAVLGES